jgi:GTP-binding protein EngB required for normal cell division
MFRSVENSSMLTYASNLGAYITPLLPTAITDKLPNNAFLHNNKHFDRDLDKLYDIKVRPLLDAVDQLRGLLSNEHNIKLPTIVVVGDQSSGKSSVLEALSGVSLPRGQNITTRCPLVLRLINTNNVNDQHDEEKKQSNNNKDNNSISSQPPYAIIGLSPVGSTGEERISDLSQVGHKIESYTSKLAGKNAGVSNQAIYLSVYRYNSPDLTLVDLPGITRNPIGDQPKDIYKQIVDMIYSYIQPEESVILNVMPATVDFPTCECVLMAKTVDSQGMRTIAVVTKPDLAERGIKTKLQQSVEQLNLRLGVVVVRNRTAEENERGVSWEIAREMEKQFFTQHTELNTLVQNNSIGDLYLGTQNLAQLLATIQEERIRSTLPKIRMKIKESLSENREKLKLFPPAMNLASECRIRLDQLINHFMQQIAALTRGDHSIAAGNNKLHLAPRLIEFYSQFQSSIAADSSKFLTSQYAAAVEEEIKENTGICLPNFLSQQVFKSLMLKELHKYTNPALQCVESVKKLLHFILQHLAKQIFTAFPQLQSKINHSIQLYLDETHHILLNRVDELLVGEEEVFSLNSYYLDNVNKIKAVLYDKLYGPNRAANLNNSTGNKKHSGSGGFLSAALGINDDNNNKSSAMINFVCNDLTLQVDLNNLTLNSNSANSSMLGSSVNSVLDMQINCYSYTMLVQKRLVDNLALLIKFHFIRSLINYSSNNALYTIIQKTMIETSDKSLLELMREDKETAVKREKLVNSIAKLEKANQVMESL